MNPLAARVCNAINEAIDSDRLVLPTMPEMAVRVREVADSPDASIKQLAAVIGGDASLTARIIKVANSAMFRGAKVIEDLNMALMRLGMTTTCSLATGLAMEQMFQATTDMVDKRMRQVWNVSSEIAGISALLCKHYTKLRPDQASLAGLLHQIGVLPILSYAEDHPSLLKDSITLEAIIQAIHPQIGVKILTAWDFPNEIRNVPLDYLNFDRKIETADYADIVTVATLQTSPHLFEGVDFSKVRAFDRLGIESSVESTELQGLSEDLAAASGMFQ